jgi:hypothetical protein
MYVLLLLILPVWVKIFQNTCHIKSRFVQLGETGGGLTEGPYNI